MLRWNTLTVIRNSNDLFIRFNPERDGDLRTWCILDGIVEQVTENLGQADSIGLNGRAGTISCMISRSLCRL